MHKGKAAASLDLGRRLGRMRTVVSAAVRLLFSARNERGVRRRGLDERATDEEGVMSGAHHAALQLTARSQEPVEKTLGRRLASKEAVEAWGRYGNPHGE